MKNHGSMFKASAFVLASAMTMTSLPIGVAQAGLVPTETMVRQADVRAARAHVQELLGRADVIAEFKALGVDPAEAVARVNALSDAEITQLAGRLDSLPAGQSAVGVLVGAALIVFIVLLITDIAGVTDVFTFVKKR